MQTIVYLETIKAFIYTCINALWFVLSGSWPSSSSFLNLKTKNQKSAKHCSRRLTGFFCELFLQEFRAHVQHKLQVGANANDAWLCSLLDRIKCAHHLFRQPLRLKTSSVLFYVFYKYNGFIWFLFFVHFHYFLLATFSSLWNA